MHSQPRDAGGTEPSHERLSLGGGVEDSDLDANPDLELWGDVLDEGLEDSTQLVGGLEEGCAHASAGAEWLWAAGIDVDAGNICGDQSGRLHGAIGVCGANLEDKLVLLDLGKHSVYDAFFSIGRRLLLALRREPEPFNSLGVLVEASRCPNHGVVDSLRTYTRDTTSE